MKVYVLITATALPDKWHDAPKAAQESVQYLNGNAKYVGKYEILQPVNGPNNEFHWLCEYASLADFEHDSDLRNTDTAWHEQWKKIDATTDGAHITSRTWRVRT